MLARVQLFFGLRTSALPANLWRHDYGILHRERFTTALIPAGCVGELVAVVPHPAGNRSALGYCLVLRRSRFRMKGRDGELQL